MMSGISRRLRKLFSPLYLNQAYHTRGFTREYNPNGVDVFAEDWDILVILDACRYDSFAEQNTLPGTLKKRTSRGSTTDEFMDGNVADRAFPETVYVTATPAVQNDKGSAIFHDTVNIWRENWDKELKTVHPEVVTEKAIATAEEYPNKRLVIHYLQPHYPFIGPTGRSEFDYTGYEEPESENRTPFWNTVGTRVNDIPNMTVRRAYEENLEIVMGYVEDLFKEVNGKIVVTSDHGEMLNDRMFPIPTKVNGHPRGLYVNKLVTVPWFEYVNGGRRTIIAEDTEPEDDMGESDIVAERLRDLGYADV